MITRDGTGNGAGAGGENKKPGEGSEGGAGGGQGGALSEEAKKEVEGIVNGAVNGALSSQLTRFKKSFTEEIGQTLQTALGPITEKLASFQPGQQQPGHVAPGGKPLDPTVQEHIARLEGRAKELEANVAKEKAAREAEAAAREKDRLENMAKEERAELASALRAKGIPEVQVKAAVALLHTEDKVVGRGEGGAIVFKIQKGTGQAKYVDEVSIEAGVDEWLKTDDGKSFLPPRQVGGSGTGPVRPGQKPANPNDAKAAATADLAKALLGG